MPMVKTQPDVLADISEKLDSILGFMAIRGIENDPAAVVIRLNEFGMTRRAIARVAGITENAVEIRLRRLKTKTAKKPAKKQAAKPVEAPVPAPPSSNPGSSA
ncbi:MAG: hypothetical protein M3N91_01175 [Pseudomonadota bacterium]|jgi:DNA-directed RNA polymerase specialized sigma24 family protein|nr:hypothetical protein [Pseudomonadota bacterium]